jgi:hypothetical protein
LNHEVNDWFRNMPEIYATTLQLELRMNQISKLISHNLAMYTPQLRQLSQQVLIAASHSPNRFNDVDWQEWCATLTTESAAPVKAATPLNDKRKIQQALIKNHTVLKKPSATTMKRPASIDSASKMKRPASIFSVKLRTKGPKVIKRHPFKLERCRRPPT